MEKQYPMQKRRVLLASIGIIALIAFITGLYIQEQFHMMPCPLCILQRYSFFLLICLGIIGSFFSGRKTQLLFGALVFVIALIGSGIAIWQSYLQVAPHESAECGAGLFYMINTAPLAHVLPKIFSGYGECSLTVWHKGFLTLPRLSALLFIAEIVLSIRLFCVRTKR